MQFSMSTLRIAQRPIESLAPLERLLAHLLVAGGPAALLANVRWPMHKALRELLDETGRTGLRGLLGAELQLEPSADGGLGVRGADRALDGLVRARVLWVDGELREARLVVDSAAAVALRRQLMLMPAEQTALYRRAGTRWAALVSTAAKNRSTAPRSSASAVTSSTPKRESGPLDATC